MRIVYKVLWSPMIWTLKRRLYTSTMPTAFNPYALKYVIGRLTQPNLVGSKLFAFGRKTTAIHYANLCGASRGAGFTVWACETTGNVTPYHNCCVPPVGDQVRMEKFWDAWHRRELHGLPHEVTFGLDHAPSGTVLVDNLTLLARIY